MSAAYVVCVAGPRAGESWPVEDVDSTGYLLFQGSLGAPDAWYRVDREADTIQTDRGPAHPAHYVGEHKD